MEERSKDSREDEFNGTDSSVRSFPPSVYLYRVEKPWLVNSSVSNESRGIFLRVFLELERLRVIRLKGPVPGDNAPYFRPVGRVPLVSRYAETYVTQEWRQRTKPVAYLEPLGEGKRVKKGEIGGRGMARAKLSRKEVAPIAQLQLRFRFCSWLPSGLLLGSQPILTRSYRTMQSARCHPKTNDSVPISPGGLHSSPTRQPDFFFLLCTRLIFQRNPPRKFTIRELFLPENGNERKLFLRRFLRNARYIISLLKRKIRLYDSNLSGHFFFFLIENKFLDRSLRNLRTRLGESFG